MTLPKVKRSRIKGCKPNACNRPRPEPALEPIRLVARWFTDDEIFVAEDIVYGGNSWLIASGQAVSLA